MSILATDTNITLRDLPDDIIETIFVDLFRKKQLNTAMNFSRTGKFLYERFQSVVQNQCKDISNTYIWLYENKDCNTSHLGNLYPLNYLSKLAIENGRLDVIQFLYGDITAPHYYHYHLAATIGYTVEYGQLEILIWFYNTMGLFNDTYSTNNALILAVNYGHFNILKWLCDNTSIIKSKMDITIMERAACANHLEIVKYLHSKEAPCRSAEIMDYIACHGRIEILKWFYENRRERPTVRAMDWAAQQGHLNVIKFLYEKWNRKNTFICTTLAIICAVQNGHFEVVKWLNENIDESNIQPHIGSTPPKKRTDAMHSAAARGNLEIVKYLYENGYKYSSHILIEATSHGCLDVVIWLCENIPKLYLCNNEAMDRAIAYGHIEVVKYLYENEKMGYFYPNDFYSTALFYGQNDVAEWFQTKMNKNEN